MTGINVSVEMTGINVPVEMTGINVTVEMTGVAIDVGITGVTPIVREGSLLERNVIAQRKIRNKVGRNRSAVCHGIVHILFADILPIQRQHDGFQRIGSYATPRRK